MKKTQKIILNISASFLSALFTYFAFGLAGVSIITTNYINVRGSDINSLNDEYYRVQYVRSDYASMSVREEIPFDCNGETLMGYLYQVSNPHGVIICAHGVNSIADGNHAQYQNYFINKEWDIFAIDMTGCGRSSGKGMKTLHESKYCVSNAIKTIKNLADTKDLPICLIGHSWGGYGVVAGSDKQNISAVASFSGYETPAGMMYGYAENNVSPAVILTKPSLDVALTAYYGNESYVAASDVIKRNRRTNYVILHGENDTTVGLKKYSIYDHVVDRDIENVDTILLKNTAHISPWKSGDANAYYDGYVIPGLAELHSQYGETIPEDKFEEFLATVDKEKSSAVNTELLDTINNIFLASIS